MEPHAISEQDVIDTASTLLELANARINELRPS